MKTTLTTLSVALITAVSLPVFAESAASRTASDTKTVPHGLLHDLSPAAAAKAADKTPHGIVMDVAAPAQKPVKVDYGLLMDFSMASDTKIPVKVAKQGLAR